MPRVLVNIDVSDLDRAIDFYGQALDLQLVRRLGPDMAELVGGGVAIFLLAKAPGSLPHPGARAPRDYGRHWTPVHLDFGVRDLEAAVARAQAAGARQEGTVEDHPWGRIAYFGDPFGHGFCLVHFHPGGYDHLADG